MAGVQELLPKLSRLMPLGIATTAEREYVESVLRREGLGDSIAQIVTDFDVAHPKPAPDMLNRLADLFDIATGALCMVGDSQSDEDMSRAAGCRFIRFGRAANRIASAQQVSAEDWVALGNLLGV
jgi:phosphoglycolate phosphatase-like HAD superfamily hydrolase